MKQRDLYVPSSTSLAYVVVRRPRRGKFALTEQEMEQGILDWVRINKSINSREAAEKCGVSQREARYLLAKMLKSGRLQSQGQRRWKRYVLP
jgi:predicted HTH transcriptional regulator